MESKDTYRRGAPERSLEAVKAGVWVSEEGEDSGGRSCSIDDAGAST